MTIMKKIKPYKLALCYVSAFLMMCLLTDMAAIRWLTLLLLAFGGVAIIYPLFNRAPSRHILIPRHRLKVMMPTYVVALVPAIIISYSMEAYYDPLTLNSQLMHIQLAMYLLTIGYFLVCTVLSSGELQDNLSAYKSDEATARFEAEMRGTQCAKATDTRAPHPAQYYRTVSTNLLLAYSGLSNMLNVIAMLIFLQTYDAPMGWPMLILIMLQLLGAIAFFRAVSRPAALPAQPEMEIS
ncbi:hypothetical protein MK852_19470 [Shewanella benthica]|nr:hypothetical protein [Shewanella benthica]